METFFGSLAHLFATANKIHIIWCAVILAIMLTLAVLHHCWRGDAKRIRVWRLLCLLPLLLCIVHEVIYVYEISEFIPAFIPLYAVAVFDTFGKTKDRLPYRRIVHRRAVRSVQSVFLRNISELLQSCT